MIYLTVYLDTLLDTLEEGRHSFLEISTFPDLLKSSNPPLSAMMTCPDDCRVKTRQSHGKSYTQCACDWQASAQTEQLHTSRFRESFNERLFCFVRVEKTVLEKQEALPSRECFCKSTLKSIFPDFNRVNFDDRVDPVCHIQSGNTTATLPHLPLAISAYASEAFSIGNSFVMRSPGWIPQRTSLSTRSIILHVEVTHEP